ncbi:hypothetical protein D9619_001910 [Psilocybe cf. subviscida]|uniref:peptidylprolyl isomerase n=1 Tax=Psilocybe cf. subviscida TaxID=2480587 RepID=A0A8H5BGT3_9AGAR|nr:hypothetical protein D9619_001910 [Psilocybe cf. subviscida]
MSIVLGIWHLVVEGGKDKIIQTPASIQITNASYGEEIVDQKSRDVIKLHFESLSPPDDEDEEDEEKDEEDDEDDDGFKVDTTVLCVLTPGKTEQTTLSLVLDSDSSFKFENVGKNTIYLTGNYIRQDDDDEPDSDDEGDYDSEDGYDLREVSSDVEMHGDDLAGLESDNSRFEEIDEEAPTKPQKRSRESDAADAAADKKSKKLKDEAGKAVEAPKEEKKEKKEKKDKKADEKKPEEKKTPKKKTLAGGVVVEDAKVGTGPMAKKGNTVRMRYVGKLTNGKEFDKNVKGKPFTFRLGEGEVIKGWDEGITGMQVGGERMLTIPPGMAYGSKKSGPIPPNSTLIFEVKLLEIK